MAFTVYKSGQGYWTRWCTAGGAGALVLWGIYWITQEELRAALGRWEYTLYVETGVAVGLLLFFAGLLWWLLNYPRIVDFMIATEAEMRKVSWPSLREITGSTWIVICGTLMLALLLLVVDVTFTWFFQMIHILPKA